MSRELISNTSSRPSAFVRCNFFLNRRFFLLSGHRQEPYPWICLCILHPWYNGPVEYILDLVYHWFFLFFLTANYSGPTQTRVASRRQQQTVRVVTSYCPMILTPKSLGDWLWITQPEQSTFWTGNYDILSVVITRVRIDTFFTKPMMMKNTGWHT